VIVARLLLALLLIGALQAPPGTDEDGWTRLWREILDQQNDQLREGALDQIVRCGPRAAKIAALFLEGRGRDIPALIAKLDADEFADREAATLALLEIGPPAVDPLKKVLQHDSAEVRYRAKDLLTRIAAQEARAPRRKMTAAALAILGRSGGREHLRLLVPFFSHEDPKLRDQAISAAGRLASAADGAVFEGLLQHPDESRRSEAVRILGNTSGPAARDRLVRLLRDEDSIPVRLAVRDVFRKLQLEIPADVPLAWAERAESKEGAVRIRAIHSLIQWSRMTRADIGVLWNLIEKCDAAGRKDILTSLGLMEGPIVARFLVDGDAEIAGLARQQLKNWIRIANASQHGWDGASLARLSLDFPPVLKSRLQEILLEESREALAFAETLRKGDTDWAVAAAVHLRAREARPTWIAPLSKMRDGLPPGGARDVVEAALFLCGEGRPVAAALRLIEDPDPRRAGLGIDVAGHLGLWEAAPRLREFTTGHGGPVTGVAFRPDGSTLVSAGSGPSLAVWDWTTARRVRSFASLSPATCLAVSADGRRAVTGHEDATVAVWNLESGDLLRVLKGHPEKLRGVALSPDGTKALSGDAGRTVLVWDLEAGRELRRWGEKSVGTGAVAWSPDGTRTLTASGGSITLRDAGDAKEVGGMTADAPHAVQALAFSRDGTKAFTGGTDKATTLWDLGSATKLRTFGGHGHGVLALAVSPDGKVLLSGSVDQTVRIWDVDSGKLLRTLEGHAGWVNSVAWDREAKTVAAGNLDGTVTLWDAATGKRLRTFISPDLRRRSQAALDALARGPAAEIGAPDLDRVRRRTAAVMESLRTEEASLVRDAFAEVKQLPLVRVPDGFERLKAVQTSPRDAEAVRQAIENRRQIPKLLVSLAAGEGSRSRLALSKAGHDRMAYQIVAGEPPAGEEAFTPEGAVRISDRTLARILVGFDWPAAIPILKNSGSTSTPEALRALLVPGEGGRYRAGNACLQAGWTDAVPALYELLEKDPKPPVQGAFLDLLVKTDPARAVQAISRWSASPSSDAQRKLVRDLTFHCPERAEIQLQLLQGTDQPLAVEVARGLAGDPSPEAMADFRRLRREGKISDAVAAALLTRHATAEDLPVLRELARSDQRTAALEASWALIRVGGAAEVDAALQAIRHDPSYVSQKVAPHVSERNRTALESLLDAQEPSDKRIVRLLLAKAGRTDTLGDVLDVPPKGTADALTVAAVAGALKDEAPLRKVLGLAENWTDRASHELIWAAIARSPLELSDAQLETLVGTASSPELRSAAASRLARAWKKERLGALKQFLQKAPGRETEELLASLEPLKSLDVAQAVLDALPFLLRGRVSSERIARILAAPADRADLAPRLLALHQESIRGMTLLDPIHVVLAAARGTRHAELQALLQTYFGSTTAKFGGKAERPISLSPRLVAAESLAASEPELPETAATAARLLRSVRPEDRAVGTYYQWRRGRRLSEVEWGLLPQGDAALFLGVRMRISTAAGDAWEGWRRSALDLHNPEESRRFQAALSLLTSRDFDIPIMLGTPELTLRQSQGLRTAREWFVAHWNKSFESSFLEALAEAGYKVGPNPDPSQAGELVRALRDSRWYLARNASWMLGRMIKDGPSVPETVLLGGSDLRSPSLGPDPQEIEAWEKWDRERRR
jgi:hypothetical protein